MTRITLFFVGSFLALLNETNFGIAADVRWNDIGHRYFELVGPIQKGDYEKIVRGLSDREPNISIFMASPGGDMEEAIKIAELLDKLMIEVIAPKKFSHFVDQHCSVISHRSNTPATRSSQGMNTCMTPIEVG